MGYKSHISDPDCSPSWAGFAIVLPVLVAIGFLIHWIS